MPNLCTFVCIMSVSAPIVCVCIMSFVNVFCLLLCTFVCLYNVFAHAIVIHPDSMKFTTREIFYLCERRNKKFKYSPTCGTACGWFTNVIWCPTVIIHVYGFAYDTTAACRDTSSAIHESTLLGT